MTKPFAEVDVSIGSNVVSVCHQILALLGEVAGDEPRFDQLTNLVQEALASFYEGMPDGATAVEILMTADLIALWALKELADESKAPLTVMQRGWALGLAQRYGLMPVPSKEETDKAIDVAEAMAEAHALIKISKSS